ncbi:MAG: porin [Syntrophales bacterium]
MLLRRLSYWGSIFVGTEQTMKIEGKRKSDKRFMVAALIAGLLLGTSPIAAADAPEERWQELNQKIRILERKLELDKEVADAEAAKRAVVEAGEKGFLIRSTDGAWQLRIRGYVQADGRFFFDDNAQPLTNDLLLRRVRPVIEGTLAKYYQFRIMPEFGSGKTELQDAYLEANRWPAAKLRVGKFKPPVGLERLQSGSELLFVERAFPTSLVPNRDVGLQLAGDLNGGIFSYALAVFDGGVDGGSADGDTNDDKDFVARLFSHPFQKSGIASLKGLGIGVAGSHGNQAGALPSFKSPGQQTFFKYATATVAAGRRWRVVPQAYYYAGPFGLLTEYVRSVQEVKNGSATEDLANIAWQVAASWVVTGEEASYKGVKPKRSFAPAVGAWGALEVAARYHELQVDDKAFPVFADPAKSAKEARAWAVGFNWYLNRNVKLAADYEETKFDRGHTTGNRETENILFTRFQVAY